MVKAPRSPSTGDEDQCHYDIRATYDDGDTGDWRNINLCATTTITLT